MGPRVLSLGSWWDLVPPALGRLPVPVQLQLSLVCGRPGAPAFHHLNAVGYVVHKGPRLRDRRGLEPSPGLWAKAAHVAAGPAAAPVPTSLQASVTPPLVLSSLTDHYSQSALAGVHRGQSHLLCDSSPALRPDFLWRLPRPPQCCPRALPPTSPAASPPPHAVARAYTRVHAHTRAHTHTRTCI